ncbi:flagellar assembly protein FliH [Fictibacillus iocasae]|uniref:Flagellar assembly protein FliH n=1 Tax=Fictibacillus iocasae TaxID=2715437 RepID=A0ABW2NNZ6_9BACL
MSNIIKQSNPSDAAAQVVIGIKQIERQAPPASLPEEITPEQLLQLTRLEAEKLIQAAEDEANELRQQMMEEYESHQIKLEQMEQDLLNKRNADSEAAKAAGYEKGFKEGSAAGASQWDLKLKEAEKIILLSREAYNSHIESSERVIVEMASAVARKITGSALKEESVWVDYVKQLIKEVRETGEIKLYVHPDWYEKTIVYRDELKNILLGTTALYIYPDASLKEYGCVIESQFGKMDATLDSQLSEIKTALLDRLEGTDDEGR